MEVTHPQGILVLIRSFCFSSFSHVVLKTYFYLLYYIEIINKRSELCDMIGKMPLLRIKLEALPKNVKNTAINRMLNRASFIDIQARLQQTAGLFIITGFVITEFQV